MKTALLLLAAALLPAAAHAAPNKCGKIRRDFTDATDGVAKQSAQFQWIANGCFGRLAAIPKTKAAAPAKPKASAACQALDEELAKTSDAEERAVMVKMRAKRSCPGDAPASK